MFPIKSANSGVANSGPIWNCNPKSNPTSPPYMSRSFLVGGVVNGSVSITVPKNMIGQDVNIWEKIVGTANPLMTFGMEIERIAAIRKTKNI